MREHVAGVSFLVSPTAFFQTNIEAAEAIVQIVLDAAQPSLARVRRVLDLYAGSGLFAAAARRARASASRRSRRTSTPCATPTPISA